MKYAGGTYTQCHVDQQMSRGNIKYAGGTYTQCHVDQQMSRGNIKYAGGTYTQCHVDNKQKYMLRIYLFMCIISYLVNIIPSLGQHICSILTFFKTYLPRCTIYDKTKSALTA